MAACIALHCTERMWRHMANKILMCSFCLPRYFVRSRTLKTHGAGRLACDQCAPRRWGYASVEELEEVVTNYTAADVPLEVGLWPPLHS